MTQKDRINKYLYLPDITIRRENLKFILNMGKETTISIGGILF